MKTLYILRGIPGSGKSTYAKRFIELYTNLFHATAIKCSADDFFIDKHGVYKFDATKLYAAHRQCQHKAATAMRQGIDLVIIDNTNTTDKEMRPYIDIAKENGYAVRVKLIGNNDEDFINLCATEISMAYQKNQ